MVATSALFGYTAAAAAAAAAADSAPLPVTYDSFTVGGLVAGDSQDAWIFHPTAAAAGQVEDRRFPVLSFGHGFTAGGDQAWCQAHGVAPPKPPAYPGPYCLPTYYQLLLTDVAAAGFIVLAPATWCVPFALASCNSRLT